MALSLRRATGVSARPASVARRPAVSLVCQASKDQQDKPNVAGMFFAGVVASSLLAGAIVPEQAEAASSGGRTGGSAGFKARRSAPAASSYSRSSTSRSYSNTTVVVPPPIVAPPVYGGYGYGSPFGGFGFSVMPTFVMPFPFFGGLLQFFFVLFAVSVVANIIRGITSGASKKNRKDDDGWGDL